MGTIMHSNWQTLQFWFDLWVETGQFNTATFNVSDLTLYGRPEAATEMIQNAPSACAEQVAAGACCCASLAP